MFPTVVYRNSLTTAVSKHLSTVDDPNFNPNSDTFQSATEEKLFPRGWTKWRGQWKRRYIGESSMAGDDMIGNHNIVS